MARKGTKIKRYGSIYGRGGGHTVITVVLMLLGIAVFAGVGWLAYAPVQEFLMETQNRMQQNSDSRSSAEASEPLPQESSSQSAASSEAQTSLPDENVSNSNGDGMKGIYLPQLRLLDEQVLISSLKSAKQAGINTVVFDAKDATGTVLFESNVALAKGALTTTPYDVKNVTAKIEENGLVPAARLFAFRDSIAPLTERDAAVLYYDTNIYWFDNAAQSGGKPWLNPYSPIAQQYIIDLATELCKNGCKVIIAEAVQFPSGYALEKAGYGGLEKNVAKAEALAAFLDKLSAAVAENGGRLIVAYGTNWLPSENEEQNAAVTASNQSLYGGSPSELLKGETIIEMPSDSTRWQEVIGNVNANISSKWYGLIPAVLADGASKSAASFIEDFEKHNQQGYLLYNPQGEYIF